MDVRAALLTRPGQSPRSSDMYPVEQPTVECAVRIMDEEASRAKTIASQELQGQDDDERWAR